MLPNRKQKILAAIVEQFIETGEPVGSKPLLLRLDFSVSSATIRNEMAILTEKGLIYQPYTSAGRIPTEKGYRFYVDHLMKEKALKEVDRRRIEAGVDTRSGDPEVLLEKVGKALVEFSDCAVISAAPSDENARIKTAEMVKVSPKIAVVVLMTSTGILKSKACRMDTEISDEVQETFKRVVEESLINKPLFEVNTVMIQTLVASLGIQALSVSPLLVTLADLVEEASNFEVHLEGSTNLLEHKEYEDELPELLRFLHMEEPLNNLISIPITNQSGVEIRIGSENRYKELKNSTTIISKYKIGNSGEGAIGIIGPTRMNYSKLIPSIKYLSDLVSQVLSEVYEEDVLKDE